MKIDQEHARARPVRRLVVPDDGAPPQRCPCCACRGAEKAWLGAIRPAIASLGRATPAHTQRCAHTRNSIACPNEPIGRAFQPKIYNNSQNMSACSPIACDRSKQQGEEGWMRSEG